MRELGRPRRLLTRERITERLFAATKYPIATVIAPAGFGKTTAIADLLERCRPNCVLVSTPNDTNIGTFIQSFASTLATHFPEMATPPSESNAGVQAAGSNVDLYVAWANRHLRGVSFTIAVDDLQRADRDSSIAAFLSRLADLSKDNVSWIFSSRTTGHLPLTRWQAYGYSDAPITADLLRMTADEASELARVVDSPVTPAQIDEWVSLTHGFPVALSYAIRVSASRGTADGIMDGTRSITFRFLAEHVWEALSSEERQLLEVAAFLPPLHVHQYEDDGILNATVMISHLCDELAFLSLSPAGSFSMHDLFRDFLRQQVSALGPALLRERVTFAASLLLKSNHFDDAFSLFIEFLNPAELADSVERQPTANFNFAVTRGIVDSTGELRLEHLGLTLLELHAEHWSWVGDATKAQRYSQEILRRADASSGQIMSAISAIFRTANFQGQEVHKYWLSLFPSLFDRLGDADRVRARAYQASLLSRYLGTQDEVRSIARDVLNQTSKLSPKAHIDTLIVLGTAYFYLNDIFECLSVARKAADLTEFTRDHRERARALNNYGVMLDRARDPDVELIFAPLRDLVERTGSWRFSHISHWLPAQYYALEANLEAATDAMAWQSATIASEELEKERLHSMRRFCLNLINLIKEDYHAIISDFTGAAITKQIDIEHERVTHAALAYGFLSDPLECEKLLAKSKQLRLSIPRFALRYR